MENFCKNRNFKSLWVPKVVCFPFFVYSSVLHQNLTWSTALHYKKNTGSTKLLSLLHKKLLSLKCKFWPVFKLKIGQTSISNLITFFLAKIEGSLNTRFFVIPSCTLCQSLIVIRQIGKKCETKYFWNPYKVKKLRFFKSFPWSPVLLDEWRLVIRF